MQIICWLNIKSKKIKIFLINKMSRIAVVYNPVQKISSAITNKIYSAEKFLENQTHHKTLQIRNKY